MHILSRGVKILVDEAVGLNKVAFYHWCKIVSKSQHKNMLHATVVDNVIQGIRKT